MSLVLGLKDEANIRKCGQICAWQESKGTGVFRTGVGRLSVPPSWQPQIGKPLTDGAVTLPL